MSLSQLQAAIAGESGWTAGRVTVLTALWGDGLSASQVARQLGGGLTRNAVIGKIHRLGLGRRRAGVEALACRFTGSADGGRPRAVKARGASLPSTPRKVRTARLADATSAATPAPTPEPRGRAVDFTELAAGQCKWPIGDPSSPAFSFCGGDAAGPYCARHAAVAYRPRTAAMIRSDRALLSTLRTAPASL